MRGSLNLLIDGLVEDLKPVRPLRSRDGGLLLAAAVVAILAIVALGFGMRPDILAGRFDAVFLLASGLFLILGLASSMTVIAMSRPRIGADHQSWIWAAAPAGLLPLSALLLFATSGREGWTDAGSEHGMACLLQGTTLGALVAVSLVLWLRRGAPTSPERAGLLTGIATGAFGIFAYALHCRIDDLAHVGLWHGLVVVVSAALGRVTVPPLIRW